MNYFMSGLKHTFKGKIIMSTTKLTISLVDPEDQKAIKKLRKMWEARSDERISLAKVVSTLVSIHLREEISNI